MDISNYYSVCDTCGESVIEMRDQDYNDLSYKRARTAIDIQLGPPPKEPLFSSQTPVFTFFENERHDCVFYDLPTTLSFFAEDRAVRIFAGVVYCNNGEPNQSFACKIRRTDDHAVAVDDDVLLDHIHSYIRTVAQQKGIVISSIASSPYPRPPMPIVRLEHL